MNEYSLEHRPLRDRKVELVTLLDEKDRRIVDGVVFGGTTAHMIDRDPWGSTLLRRIGESVVVRDYLGSFARTEDGARRVLHIALGLARMTTDAGTAGAAALSIAGWCALSLGRWELADALALRALKVENDKLAERIRRQVQGVWFGMLLEIEPEFGVTDVRRCSDRVFHEITTPRAWLKDS